MEYEETSSLSSKAAIIQGELMPVSKKEVNSLKIAFSLTHPHSTNHLGQTDDIFFLRFQPEHIFFSTGDFGAKPIPVDVRCAPSLTHSFTHSLTSSVYYPFTHSLTY
jgi:hypothetical protein